MSERSWERLGAGCGLLSAVLLAAAIFVLPPARGTDMSYAAIAQYAADNATLIRISGLLATLAMVSFVWFVGHLRHVLQRAEGGAEACWQHCRSSASFRSWFWLSWRRALAC